MTLKIPTNETANAVMSAQKHDQQYKLGISDCFTLQNLHKLY